MKTIDIDCLINNPILGENNEIIYEHEWDDEVSYIPCIVLTDTFMEDGALCVKIVEV